MWGIYQHHICDNCYPKMLHASYPPEAHNVINDKTHCSQHCIVWPAPCLCNGFSLLKRIHYSHLWNTALSETPEHTLLRCTKEKKLVCKYYILHCVACCKSSNKYYLHKRHAYRELGTAFFYNSIVTVPSPNSTYQQSFTRTNKH